MPHLQMIEIKNLSRVQGHVVCMLTDLTGVVANKLKSASPYVLASLVKLFFRSLPDPLFTESLYTRFAEGIGT